MFFLFVKQKTAYEMRISDWSSDVCSSDYPESASAYGRSKGDGEAAVRAGFADAAILRPSILFGREDHFINRFATMMRMSPIMPVIAPGAKLQPVYVGDVADVVVAALASDAAGTTYELGDRESTRLNSSN